MNLSGKTALITGAARRVGRAMALDLAHQGCNIALHCHQSIHPAESLAEDIRRMSRECHVVQADLADPASWLRIVEDSVRALGSLDILINNASIFGPMSLEAFDLDEWDRTLRINVTAAAGLCHYAADHLARSGCGKIVNLTDIAADRPWSNQLAYCASKAALVNLTKALAKTLAPRVQVNAVSPGIAVFPEDYDEDVKAKLIAKVPLQRPGTPEDIAKIVRFLCADGDYITGQVISVDGGRSIV